MTDETTILSGGVENLNINSQQSTSTPDAQHNPDNFYSMIYSDVQYRVQLTQGETMYTIGGETWNSILNNSTDKEEILSQSENNNNLEYFIEMMQKIAASQNLTFQELRRNTDKSTVDIMLRKDSTEKDFIEVRVAVIGNVDAGKSTVLGVLTHAELDNGRGYARQKLFRHRHELESGRTSAVGSEILGFDNQGSVVNKASHHAASHPLSSTALNQIWQKVCANSSKIITFVDLAGHEKYLKTTVFGMTGHLPDFCMLIVGSNQGVVGMSKEHLGLALALNVPVFVVVTKIDMCPKNVLDSTLKTLHKILKSPACRKMPFHVKNDNDVVMAGHTFSSERICPIFQVSNVTGENLDLLKSFLNLLTSRSSSLKNVGNGKRQIEDVGKVEVLLDDSFSVAGVGTVLSGTVLSGVLKANTQLLFGPDGSGKFVNADVKTLQRRRLPVDEAKPGQTVAAAVRKVKRKEVRKGQVLISKSALEEYRIPNDKNLDLFAAWDFLADVLILHHPTTISIKYQAMIHVGAIRQTGVIKWMDKDRLRTGDRARVKFSFLRVPELIRPGQKFVFREGRTKAVGTVVECLATQRDEREKASIGRPRAVRQIKNDENK
jgi:GTPase